MNMDVVHFEDNASLLKERLMQIGIQKHFEEGDVFLNEKMNIRSIPIVLSGSLKVLRTDDQEREILLYHIHSGESCVMSFLAGLHHETSKVKAVADEPSELLLIPADKIHSLLKEFPEWLDYIFRLYHKRFEELLEVVNAIAFTKMDDRLLQLLRKKSSHSKSRVISITHEQLASELGTAREVISRLLKQMEEKRLVKLGRNKIELM